MFVTKVSREDLQEFFNASVFSSRIDGDGLTVSFMPKSCENEENKDNNFTHGYLSDFEDSITGKTSDWRDFMYKLFGDDYLIAFSEWSLVQSNREVERLKESNLSDSEAYYKKSFENLLKVVNFNIEMHERCIKTPLNSSSESGIMSALDAVRESIFSILSNAPK